MDINEFAKLLMADDRWSWQNPDEIFKQIIIQNGSCAADLGCGPGFFTIPLSKRIGKGGKIYAVDESQVMLDHLSTNIKNVNSEQDIAEIIPIKANVRDSTNIPDSIVDCVLFANLLHDLENQKAFFAEVDRILKAKGIIVDVDWQKRETEDMGPPIERRLSENQTRLILRENGFRIIHAINSGPYHYGLVCQRTSDLPQ